MQQETFKGTGPEHPTGSEGHWNKMHAGVYRAQSTQQSFQCQNLPPPTTTPQTNTWEKKNMYCSVKGVLKGLLLFLSPTE